MKKTIFLTVLLGLFLVSTAIAERWVALEASNPGDPPQLNVVRSDQGRTVIEVNLPGFWVSEQEVAGQKFQELSIPGQTTTMEVGKPALPVIRTLVAIPGNARVEVSYKAGESVVLEGYRVYPFQEPQTDEQSADFAFDEEAYRSTLPYPGVIASVGDPAIWRHLRVVLLEIAPVSYVAGYLEINPNPVIELRYHSGGKINLLDTQVKTVSEHWARVYEQHVINYDHLNISVGDPDSPGPVYLIITHPNFESAIQPLADWHHKEGMETEVVSISTSSPSTIKNEITTRYNQGDLEYVLLVGNVHCIPAYYWSGHLSDYWYACITGGPDIYADVALGRLSVTTSSDAENQVAKILTYEKNPPRDLWCNKIMLVAHKEDAPLKYVECKEYIRNSIIPPPYVPPFWALPRTYYGHEPLGTNAEVMAAINEGKNIVNYRGHGSDTAWAEWNRRNENWSIFDVYALRNGNHTPIVFNIACSNNNIASNHPEAPDCLGEAWLNKYPGGAVASLGASDASYTDPNHDYDKELFREFCRWGDYRIGWMSNDAATYIINIWGYYGQENAKMYLWLGDPATEIWTWASPLRFCVSHPDTLPPGPSSFTVHVEDPRPPPWGGNVYGAIVCLWKGDEVYLTRMTNEYGNATFSLSPSTEGTMYVTVSKHDYIPYEGEAQVTSVSCQNLTPIFCRGKNLYFKLTVHNPLGENISGTLTFSGYAGYDCDPANLLVAIPRTRTYPPGTTHQYYFFQVPSAAAPGQYSTSISGALEPGGHDVFCCMNVDIIQCGPFRGGGDTDWELVEVNASDYESSLPASASLSQCYPNPFNAQTVIEYQLPVSSTVKLEIYNLLGSKVATLMNGEQQAGYKSVTWDASDVSSGLYFYKLTAGDFTETKRMMLVK